MGQVDGWMSSLLGAMTKLESDPTALYELLAGRGSFWDLIKSSYLFVLSVVAGLLVFVIYLVCCLPKLCYKYFRRMCCCSKCCASELKFCSRTVWTVALAALALAGVVFGCLVITYQVRGVGGTQQLYCQAYVFVEETLRGTAALDDENTLIQRTGSEEFGGLLPLIDNVTSLAVLVDGANPENILEQSKKAAIKALDVAPLAEEMGEALSSLSAACTAFYANNSLSGGFHKSLWCEANNGPNASGHLSEAAREMTDSAKKIVDLDPKQHVDKIFASVKLPVLNIEASFPVETVKELFFKASDALAGTEETVSKLLRWLGIGLNVDCGLFLAFLPLVLLWTVWFFCRGTKASSVTPAVLWNLLTWVVVVFLVFAGVLGWVTTVGRQGCSIVTNNFLEQDQWGLLSDYAPVVEPLVSQCLAKEGQGDLLAGAGLDEAFDQTLGMLKKTIEDFPTAVRPLDPETSGKEVTFSFTSTTHLRGLKHIAAKSLARTKVKSLRCETCFTYHCFVVLAEGYLKAAASFGALVAADPNSAPESRKDVFPEFLKV